MGSIATRRFSRGLLATTALTTTALTGLGALLAPVAASAGQLPTGYATAYGSVGFQRSSGTLTINQGTPAAIVNYNSFSIGRRNRVTIHQPGVSSVLLNRVVGSTTSVIAGRLSANGQVYLVNPNGIAITKSGVVKVGGGFVASSLAISDDDFVNGRRRFAGTGHSARVSNAGTITIGRRGYAALIGGEVRNTGTIAVPMGTVALGSGEMATLDVSGDGFMQVAVPTAAAAKGALITDTGRISGVTVLVDAATARAAARNAVNISGTIDSHTISGHGGTIQIGGGDGGAVAVSGRLSVASRRGRGGAVTVTGAQIALTRARVQAQGGRGGGTVRIGGDLHGGGTLPHAGTVTVDARSVIDADATRKGNGGSVVVWSDGTTSFAGRIFARGGVFGGNGGSAEISGGTLALTGTANVTAPRGALGTILLDPRDLTITDTPNGTNTAPAPTSPNIAYDTNGTNNDSYVTPGQIEALTGNVDIQTTRDLTVASPLTYNNGSLTLEAGRNLIVSNSVAVSSAPGTALSLVAASSTIPGHNSTGALTVNGSVSGYDIDLYAGSGGIAIGADVTAQIGLNLTTTGAVTQKGGVVSTSDLYGNAGSIALPGANAITGIGTYGDGLTAASGGIALTTSVPLTVGPNAGAMGNVSVPSGQTISLTTDSLTIQTGANPAGTPTLSAPGGAVVISPYTAGGSITVTAGAKPSAGLSLTNTELAAITAGTLQLGTLASPAGSIAFTGSAGQTVAISPSGNIGALALDSSGAVTQSAPLAAPVLTGTAGSLALTNSGNVIPTLGAFGAASGSAALVTAGNLAVTGAVTSTGNITLQAATISTSGAASFSALTTTTLATTAPITISTGGTTSAGNQVYSPTFVDSQLANGSLTLTTTGGGLTVASPVTWSSGSLLTLTAANAIAVNAPIMITGSGGLALNAATTTTNVASPQPLLSFGNGASVSYAAGPSGIGIAGQSLTINGAPYTLVYTTAQLQAIDANPTGNYALAQNIDATGVTGFTPIGESTAYTGTFNGLNNTISNLTISTNASYAGLFGQVGQGGTVKNVGLVGGSVTDAGAFVGGLVGYNVGGTITQAYATGAVSGGAYVGGLAGENSNGGTVTQAYATGAVSGSFNVGGLVGLNDSGTITQAYATGAVSGGNGSSELGGLVGYNHGGTITQAYATGAVSGASYVGGLVGDNDSGGAITLSAFDTQTTGQSVGVGAGTSSGVTALTTAQLQSTGTANPFLASGSTSPTGFAGGAAGTQNGVYPYLTSFFPNGVQAVSGLAYKDAGTTVAASGANGAVTVSLDANGGRVAQATTGANGYYYAFVPAGTAAAGSSLLVSTTANATTGATNSATLSAFAGASGNTGGVNLYGTAVTVPTAATLLSLAPSLATAQALAKTAAGTDTNAAAAVAATTGQGFVAAGTSFTIDQAVTTPTTLVVQTAAGAPLTVAQPVTIQSGGSLGLLSGGALAVDAPVTAQGAATVALGAATSIVPGTKTSVLDLAFAQGDAITFTNPDGSAATGPVAGQALSINGTPYTLLYTLAEPHSTLPDNGTSDVAGIDANTAAGGDNGNYALATNLDGTGTTFGAALAGSGGNAFNGTFEGLGHTVSNLTISTATSLAGLFGDVGSLGTVRDIGVVGGSVSGGGNLAALGGLAGVNDGTITQAYATDTVGGGGSEDVGGLVGINRGTITQAYATGAVGGFTEVGGLVGNNDGMITQAYATGAVSGLAEIGGLVGPNDGSITQAYATGAVSGEALVGGLVGVNGGSITQTYATGAVSGSQDVGGLVGANQRGTTAQSAFDTQTTGQSVGIGQDNNNQTVTALTTAQLQSTATANPFLASGSTGPTGFAGGAAGGEAGVYPYLTSFFPNGVQAVSGFAYTDAGLTPLASPATSNGLPATQRPGYVTVTAGTTTLATVTTGANGYYYTAVAAGSLPIGTTVAGSTIADPAATTINGTTGSGAVNAVSFTNSQSAAANVAGLNVYGGYASAGSYDAKLADAIADYPASLQAAESANPTVAALAPGLKPGYLALGPSFALDAQPAVGALVAGGTGFAISTATTITGPLTIAAPSIAFDAPVTVNGGQLTLNTNAAGTLTFAAPLQYNPAGANQSLTIEGNAYTLIYTEAQLLGLSGKGNGTYDALAASFTSSPPNGTAYPGAPIATYAGTLEGLGNTITGLTINATVTSTNVGLIGTLGTGGTLRDIGLVGGSVQGYANVGMLVGTNAGAIVNAYATGTMSGGNGEVGGLVGTNTGTIANSYATGTVNGVLNAGGLVGENDEAIAGSYATGAVSGSENLGGLVGFDNGGAIATSYATGAVSGPYNLGGLVGFANNDAISQVYATGSVTEINTGGGGPVGGLVGDAQNATITQGYASGAVNGTGGGFVGYNFGGTTIIGSYYDMVTTKQTSAGYNVTSGVTGLTTTAARGGLGYYPGFTAGDWYQTADLRPILTAEAAPTVAGVTTIGNSHQLELAGQNPAGTYVLPQNVDVSDTAGSPAGVFSTNGFEPLGGTGGNASFTGTFDGLGHTLTGLTVAQPGLVGGLFGVNAGTIEYVGLVGGSVSGGTAGDLAGENAGTIVQSFATGTVHGSNYAGGLAGISGGANASINQSFATGAVTVIGFDTGVGGLVGYLSSGTITASYAQGSVTGASADFAGGFVGWMSGGTINQAYATGTVSGGTAGGFAGFVSPGAIITSAYFDSATTKQTAGVGTNTGGTATVTALSSQATPGSAMDAFTNANYVGFDQAVWAPASRGTPNYYPQLYGVSGVVGVKDPDATSVYGTTPNVAATAPTYYGLGPYNTLTSPATITTAASAQSDVGTYAITSTGTAATYTPGTTYLGPATRIVDLPGTLTITPATLTVSAVNGITKTYDGTTALPPGTVSYTFSGVVNGDAVGVAAASDAYDSPNAGMRMIDATGLTITGAKAMDYMLSAPSVTSTGTINPAPLTYVANAASRTYGAANPPLSGTVTGFVAGQTQASATTGTLAFTTQATASSNVGAYAIYGSGLTADNGNYTFAQASGNATALMVMPAPLTVSGAKAYDGTTGFATGQLAVAGAVNGETVMLTQGTGTAPSADAGTYPGSALSNLAISVSGGNAMASNYMLPGSGTLVIGKAIITVAGATGVDKTYDATTALPNGATGFTYTGEANGAVTVAARGAMYDSPNAGMRTIDVVGLTLSGAAAGDYVLSTTSVMGSGTITPAPVTVTANGGRSIYGNDPANPGLSASGLQGGQSVGVLTGLSNSFGIDGRTHAGSYTLTVQGTSTNGNYQVVATNDGTFTVDPRALTVAANDQSRRYGAPNPPLTYALGGMGLVNGDTLTGALTTTATRASGKGSYPIDQGTLAATSDYVVTYVPGTLTVGPAPVPVPTLTTPAVDLASTADRAVLEIVGQPSDTLPFVLDLLAGDGPLGARIVAGLGDPRFDEIVVCAKDFCTIIAPKPRKSLRTSRLETP